MRKVARIRVFESCASADSSILEIDTITADRADVLARVPVTTTDEDKLNLVRQIIADRFGIEAGKITWSFV